VKKIIILAGVVVLLALAAVVITQLDVPEKIKYSMNRMGSFDPDRYHIEYSDVTEKCIFSINDKTLSSAMPITILELADGAKLIIESIVYEGNLYNVKIVSVGQSTFDGGSIILVPDAPDITIETDVGTVVFGKMGTNRIIKDSLDYAFWLYAINDDISNSDMAAIDVEIQLTGLTLKSYTRK